MTKRTHSFTFNRDSNGEHVVLTTTWEPGDPPELASQSLSLQAYGRSASMELPYDLTPARLRELADELESAEREQAATVK